MKKAADFNMIKESKPDFNLPFYSKIVESLLNSNFEVEQMIDKIEYALLNYDRL